MGFFTTFLTTFLTAFFMGFFTTFLTTFLTAFFTGRLATFFGAGFLAPNSMTGDSVDRADERTATASVGGITKPWDEPMSAMPKPRASRRRTMVRAVWCR